MNANGKLMSALVTAIAPVIRDHVEEAIRKAIAPLLARIAELEEREFYQGVFQQDQQYVRGVFATHNGSVWHANRTTRQRPGDGPDWTLAVKCGRDGRDGKDATR